VGVDERTKLLIALAVALGVAVGMYAGVAAYSSVDPPFSVIQSESMQHSQDESAIGVLDTGDMVLVRDPSKVSIKSYVEGRQSGYSAFGDYGDVIIYKRPGQTPVIHRAMLWLDNNGDGTWTADALKNYPKGADGLWDNPGDYDSLHGTLVLRDVGYGHQEISILLSDSLGERGFLTKGDNAKTNKNFDQSVGISPELIATEDIRSVPVLEIPWLGCVKMYVNKKNVDKIPGNSLPSLAFFFITLFSAIFAAAVVYQSLHDMLVGPKEEEPKAPQRATTARISPKRRGKR